MLRSFALLVCLSVGSILPVSAVAGDVAVAGPAVTKDNLIGTWKMNPLGEAAKSLESVKFALREPIPTDAEIEGTNFGPEIQNGVRAIIEMRRADPNHAIVAQTRTQLAAMEDLTLVVTPDKFKVNMGADSERAYRIDKIDGNVMTIVAIRPDGSDDKPAEFAFTDANHIDVSELGKPMFRLVRK